MAQGDKSKYTDKQKRKAEHIEQSYEDKGVPEEEAEARAWATVNKQSGGGERSGGSGTRKSETAKRADRKDSAHRASQARHGDSPNKDKPAKNTSLSSLTVKELQEKARERQVEGRSKMRKDELIKALS